MTYLPWLLLATTLAVRALLSMGYWEGFLLDLLTVPGWLWLYWSKRVYPLLGVPLVFGFLDVVGMVRWQR